MCAATSIWLTCCAIIVCRSHTDEIEEVSRNLLAAPRIRGLAHRIVSRLSAAGPGFNGVHLRLEQDASFQSQAAGGEAVRPITSPYTAASCDLLQ